MESAHQILFTVLFQLFFKIDLKSMRMEMVKIVM